MCGMRRRTVAYDRAAERILQGEFVKPSQSIRIASHTPLRPPRCRLPERKLARAIHRSLTISAVRYRQTNAAASLRLSLDPDTEHRCGFDPLSLRETAEGRVATFYEELATYRDDDFPRLVHALKAALAVVVTMLICMRLELRTPRTGMVSAAIVMLPMQSGMIIGRAFYRALGLCVGCFAGLTLLCLFSQQPALFIAGLAVWIGLFTAGSSYYKNFQSYGFVLSGYAASITAVPEWTNPYDVSTNVIHVVSEVVIGVAVGSLVGALAFPRGVSGTIRSWGQKTLTKLLTVARSAILGKSDDEQTQAFIGLLNDTVAIEGLRTAAVFEDPEMRLRNDALLKLDRSFLDVIPGVRSIYRARQLAIREDADTEEGVRRILAPIAALAERVGTLDFSARGALVQVSSELNFARANIPGQVSNELAHAAHRQPLHAELVEMAAAQAFALLASLGRFCDACLGMLDQPRAQFVPSALGAIQFLRTAPMRSNGTVAAMAGVRAAIAVALVGTAWIASGWDDGFSALVAVAISAGLFSSNPVATTASWQLFTGCAASFVVAFILNFYIFPLSDDVTLTCVYIGTIIMVGSYTNTFPKVATIGAGFCVFFCYIASPSNPAVYDPAFLLDRGFALLLGLGSAALSFSLIFPREGLWVARRYGAQVRDILDRATRDESADESSPWIGPALRDAIVQMMSVQNIPKDFRNAYLAWAFGALSISNAIVQLRALGATHRYTMPTGWADVQRHWLDAISSMARTPNPETTQAAIHATEQALNGARFAQPSDKNNADSKSNADSGNKADSKNNADDASHAEFEIRAHLYTALAALMDQRVALPLCSRALT